MQVKRIQNKIAESRFALPVTAIYATGVCLAGGLLQQQLWIQMACLVVAAMLMVELNNSNSLIRIYSRMVSCSFLVLSTAASFLFPSLNGAVVLFCYAAFYVILFRAYQNKRATGVVFNAFFFIGTASIFFIQILFLIPVLWIILAANINAFSRKTFWASILGTVMPYWFVGAYHIYNGKFDFFATHFTQIAHFGQLFDYSLVTDKQIMTFAYIAVLALTGTIHFLRNSYKDKIRTRMFYEAFITIDLCCAVFLILQPQHFDCLMRIMIINTAPLTGHFIALTRTRITNAAFQAIILLSLIITACNLWMP